MHGFNTQRIRLLALVACLCAMPALAHAAPPDDGERIALQGDGHGTPACSSCHGEQGQGDAAIGAPRLAHLSVAYIVAQLEQFSSGTRVNAIMAPISKSLSPSTRAALGAYFSALPVTAEKPAAPTADATLLLGKTLATRGRWSDGLPACEQCHGPGGVGVGPAFPPLSGQSAAYLAQQLHAWKQGMRPSEPLGLMTAVAAKLSDADVEAVADYYSTLPARAGSPP